ncbi:uncharacterized protein [Antedon mediterranea]|uniref:uncharacterized protein n=1 Tax=Antedon mediterranea TaxID=105859 RepID=UPI003AF794AD
MEYTITLNVTNSIGSTIDSTTCTVQTDLFKPCECEETTEETGNNSPGLLIGMFFVGIFIGALGLSIGLFMYTKTTQKQTTNKEKTEKKQDTYMEYTVERPTDGENHTYQDLQHKVEESAYVNVKTGNRNKGLKV